VPRTVRPPEAVRSWLYGVAVRTAQEARAVSARRLAREVPVAKVPDRAREPAEPPDADALRVLDEEVAALPDHLRAAVVLCELDGLGRRDAAERLGVPEGTLSSRLAKARKLLADRLRKRGVVLPTAGLTVLAHATVPSRLAAQTSTFATSGAVVPTAVAALTQKVSRTMFLVRLKSAAQLVPLVAGLLGGAVLVAVASEGAPPVPSRSTLPAFGSVAPAVVPSAANADPKPLPKGPNKLLLHRTGNFTLLDPDGKNDERVSKDRELYHAAGGAMLSPDGKQLAVMVLGPPPPDDGTRPPKKRTATLHVRGLDEKEPGTSLGVEGQTFAWSPDGTEIACCDFAEGPELVATHAVVNVKTKKKSELKLPNDHILTDWSRDGKLFLTMRVVEGKRERTRLYLMNRDGTENKALTGENHMALFGRISPDGNRVLFNRVLIDPDTKPSRRNAELAVVDVATGKVTKVDGVPPNGGFLGYCWSPSGRTIAYVWQQIHEGTPEDLTKKDTVSRLIVCDPDGKNPKTIVSEKGEGQYPFTLGSVDWR
jgi:dipeptidyl aminopeptidase/acylaminoacyl peptidase/predicted DNA-binding protein (UPF0251 family)